MPIQDPLTGLIIGCCFRVAKELGPGFLEKVYENALAHELRKAKVKAYIPHIGDMISRQLRAAPPTP